MKLLNEQILTKNSKIWWHGSRSDQEILELDILKYDALSGFPAIYLTQNLSYAVDYSLNKDLNGFVKNGLIYRVEPLFNENIDIFNPRFSKDHTKALKYFSKETLKQLTDNDWWLICGSTNRAIICKKLKNMKYAGFFNYESDSKFPSIGLFYNGLCEIKKAYIIEELSNQPEINSKIKANKMEMHKDFLFAKKQKKDPLKVMKIHSEFFNEKQLKDLIKEFELDSKLIESFLEDYNHNLKPRMNNFKNRLSLIRKE
jgi:hypothetical protein